METDKDFLHGRRVLVGTVHGVIEGDLALGPQLRTLDYLNRTTTRFVSLRAARPVSPGTSLQGEAVHVNIESIFWVAEVEAMRRAGGVAVKPQLNRSAVRLCFPDWEILGFLHTPMQGDPFARLNQERCPFIAVTSASIIGSDTERAAAFLAVNSRQVFTVELLADEETVEEEAQAFEETGS